MVFSLCLHLCFDQFQLTLNLKQRRIITSLTLLSHLTNLVFQLLDINFQLTFDQFKLDNLFHISFSLRSELLNLLNDLIVFCLQL